MCENRVGIKMLRILLTVTLVTLVAGYGVLTPKFEWNGGFQASISLMVNQTYLGWCIHIVFDEPLQSIEILRVITQQNITCQGSREFVVTNKEDDTDLQKGSTLDMDIVGRTNHSNFVAGKVYLAHQCSGCIYSGPVGCKDQLSDCQDLQQRVNICSSKDSAENLCPMTCGICTTPLTTPLHLTSVSTGCKDQLDDCQTLQQRVNICSDLASAQKLCPMTCGICTTKPIPLTTTPMAITSTHQSKTTATSTTTTLPPKPTTTITTTLPPKPTTTSTTTQLPSKPTTTSTTTQIPSKPITTSTTTQLPSKTTTTSTTTTLPSKTTMSSATTKSSSHVLGLSSTSLACSDKVNSCRGYFDDIPCTDQRFLSWAKKYCAATCNFC